MASQAYRTLPTSRTMAVIGRHEVASGEVVESMTGRSQFRAVRSKEAVGGEAFHGPRAVGRTA